MYFINYRNKYKEINKNILFINWLLLLDINFKKVFFSKILHIIIIIFPKNFLKLNHMYSKANIPVNFI